MATTLKQLFDDACGDLVIDKTTIERIYLFAQGFLTKNPDHMKFFGGSLIGVNPVRWVDTETDHWFEEIIGMDDIDAQKKIYEVPGIESNWNVASNVLNLSMVYMVYRIYNTPGLDPLVKESAMINVLELLQYRFISSLMYHYFPHPADKATAQTAYSLLTKKYGLKLYGSWSRYITRRAEDIISPGSIHKKAYTEFKDTKAIVYMLNDIQGRVRSVVKNISAVFYMVKESNQLITSSSMVGNDEEGTYLKDKRSALIAYKQYIVSIIPDENSFVRSELVSIILKKMHTAKGKVFTDALRFLAGHYGEHSRRYLETLVDETLLHAFDYMAKRRIKTNDLPTVIDKLKTLYTASRTADPSVLLIRSLGDDLVVEALPGSDKGERPVVAPERTAVLLYIVLRTLASKHYS